MVCTGCCTHWRGCGSAAAAGGGEHFPAGRITPSDVALDCSIVIHHVQDINFYQVRAHILLSRPLGIATPATSLPRLEMTPPILHRRRPGRRS